MTRHKHQILIKLPWKFQSIIFLIREELKSRKLFRVLEKIGIVDSILQPHLDAAILRLLNYDETDEAFDYYNRILEKCSRKIANDNLSATKQALKAYKALLKKNRANSLK